MSRAKSISTVGLRVLSSWLPRELGTLATYPHIRASGLVVAWLSEASSVSPSEEASELGEIACFLLTNFTGILSLLYSSNGCSRPVSSLSRLLKLYLLTASYQLGLTSTQIATSISGNTSNNTLSHPTTMSPSTQVANANTSSSAPTATSTTSAASCTSSEVARRRS